MADSVTDREKSIRAAKLAEQSKRYDEMVEEMNKVAKMGEELTVEEMNLLSVGYKNTIGSRRILWRNLSTIKLKVESEIIKICGDILPIIEEHLIPTISTTEAAVFYYKMKGDAYMYLAEIKTGDERKKAVDASCEAYGVATIVAEANLQPADPIRLSVALNRSVFYYVILHEPDSACEIGEEAIFEAKSGLDRLSEDEQKESTITLSIIEENIKLWKSEMENQDKPDQEEDVKEDEDDYMDVDDEIDEDEEKDEGEDRAGGSELSRSEKKSRKAMLNLGMEPVTGVSLVTFKCSKKGTYYPLRAICNPDVFKSPKTETYIIFGEVNYNPWRPVGETLCLPRFSQITLAEKDREDLEVDETGIAFCDIVTVMTLTNASRTKAVEALRNHNGDVVNAAMELLEEIAGNAAVYMMRKIEIS